MSVRERERERGGRGRDEIYLCVMGCTLDKKSLISRNQSTDSFIISPHTDNTPEIVVNSLIEGGLAIRGVSHRLLLPLLACHSSDTEQPMLLFPKTSLGPLKQLLVRAREPKSGGMVSQLFTLYIVNFGAPGGLS